jgi:hypothetical protein
VVGDANVPRGQLTWRTAAGQVASPAWRMPVQLRLRDAPNDPMAYWWSPLGRADSGHTVEWQPAATHIGGERKLLAFDILGPAPNGKGRGRFHRVSALEALEAARLRADAL